MGFKVKFGKMLSATIAATMLASVMTACGGGNATAVQSGSEEKRHRTLVQWRQ